MKTITTNTNETVNVYTGTYDAITEYISIALGEFAGEFDMYAIFDDAFEWVEDYRGFVLTDEAANIDGWNAIIQRHEAVKTVWCVRTYGYRMVMTSWGGVDHDKYASDTEEYDTEEEARAAYDREAANLPREWHTEKACGHCGDFGYGVELATQKWAKDEDGELYPIDDTFEIIDVATYDTGDAMDEDKDEE